MVLDTVIGGLTAFATPLVQPLFVPLLYYTLQALATILAFWAKGDRIQDEKDFLNPLSETPYDYIIVGAGSAGSLLANRLSRQHTVLLLEAGGEPNVLQFIPAFGLFLIDYPQTDWRHRSVPQKYGSLNSINQQSSWSTGLGLGGTGNLNLMIHLRGHRRDFDNWASYLGDPSWSWEGVLPHFRSYEDYEIPGDEVNHGYRGDLRIEAPDYIGTAREFVKACGEVGYPNVDLNAPFIEGCDVIRYPLRQGMRQAPFKAFLQPIRSRSTLTIMKFAHVNKILFRNGNIAYGVEYDRHGKTYTATAGREVIISAGSVGTPKLLMLSGVGPKPHLDEHNIPVRSNLPVGQNLQDHLAVYLGPFFVREGLSTYFDRDFTPSEFVKWFSLGRGVLSSTGCEAAGIITSEIAKARGEVDWPDIVIFQYAFTNFRIGAQNIAKTFNLKQDEIVKYMQNDIGKDSLYMVIQQSRPVSRGHITLGGSSPYDRQVIEPNYLSDLGDIDLKVMLDGIKKTLRMFENTTTGQNELGARFTTTKLPGCEHLEFRSDPYWECFIRRFSVTLHHPVGTASMGTVVDTELRVIGTRNLRVVDASVQPFVVTTNTQASTLMIAEKGADMILRALRYPKISKPSKTSFNGPPLWNSLGGDPISKNRRADLATKNITFMNSPVSNSDLKANFAMKEPKQNSTLNRLKVNSTVKKSKANSGQNEIVGPILPPPPLPQEKIEIIDVPEIVNPPLPPPPHSNYPGDNLPIVLKRPEAPRQPESKPQSPPPHPNYPGDNLPIVLKRPETKSLPQPPHPNYPGDNDNSRNVLKRPKIPLQPDSEPVPQPPHPNYPDDNLPIVLKGTETPLPTSQPLPQPRHQFYEDFPDKSERDDNKYWSTIQHFGTQQNASVLITNFNNGIHNVDPELFF